MSIKRIRPPIILFLLCLMIGTVSIGYGSPSVKPISTPELKQLLNARTDVLLINVLPPIIHDSKHLPGSINYPIGKMERQRALPFPLDQPLVFYCMGVL